ncbi:MAG: phage terminase large subunit [Acidobacteria bacterium]|nr:phage terminase large subunit [Acidobacteriota bacterium]
MNKQQQIDQELSLKPFAFQQKVEACRVLYLNCQGRHHDYIQQEMRKLGNDRWNNRCLYARWSNGTYIPGWPERFGWKSEPPASAGGIPRRERNLAKSRNRSKQRRLLKLAAKAGNAASNAGNAAAPGCTAGPSGLSEANNPGNEPTSDSTNSTSPKNSQNFLSWLKKLSGPYNWDWNFQRYVIEKLEAFERGDTRRLMLFVPPRHGKSELVTVRYAAWHLQRNPKSNIIIGSYNQRLANRFSRKIRNVYAEAGAVTEAATAAGAEIPTHDKTTCAKCIAGKGGLAASHCGEAMLRRDDHPTASGGYASEPGGGIASGISMGDPSARQASPQCHKDTAGKFRSRRIQTDAEWETADGGGVRAVGCGSGITGFGANLIIIDDPVKSRSEAESQTIRDKVFDWFNDDIYTRLEPDGKMILIQTRWHEDDLAGRLLREMQEDEDAEQWEVINFPAIAEDERRGEEERRRAGDELSIIPPTSDRLITSSPLPSFPSSPQKPLFYTRNGQLYPIHTLGDPAKKKKLATDHTDETDKENTNSLGTANCPSTGHPDGDHPTTSLSVPSVTSVANSPTDILGRRAGDALCPERYPIERLLKTKKRLGTYSFTALYQQRPIPAEGGFFKRHWFKIVDHVPPGLKWKRGYDLGMSASPGADYTATARVAFDCDGNMYIDRVLRRRMEYPEQRRAILGLIATEHDTEHFIEKSANGNAVIQDLRREHGISDRHFRGVEVRESKTARAFTWNALAEEGRVHLIRSAWNLDFIDEACSFPGGVNDDQIDAVSIAVKMLREEKGRQAHGF